MNDELWNVKLAARLHDPAEKALVLLRDPAGHEGGSVRVLKRLAGLDEAEETCTVDPETLASEVAFRGGLPKGAYHHIRRADRWASAADRPNFPYESGNRYADWAQVRFTEHPELVHPLSGERLDLRAEGGLSGTDVDDIKNRSIRHFTRLIVKDGDATDSRKSLLALWRFGPELAEEKDAGRLGHLWRHLPADTRIPDHSIWDHLDLASAFAGAFAADPDGVPALLTLSIGPVQGFIEAARSTSDLWAGSHLLARLAWETMKPLVTALGPDALIFPRLRGVPQVDLWLRNDCQLPDELFRTSDAAAAERCGTDAHPLFCAALPNRFVAIVPAARAKNLAEACAAAGREYMLGLGRKTVGKLLDAAEIEPRDDLHAYRQVEDQLRGFPEVHWASASFALAPPRDATKNVDPDTARLFAALAPFHGAKPDPDTHFLASQAWKLLSREITLKEGFTFYRPNPGVLYPALFDLAERTLQSAKAVRTFEAYEGHGYRCSLTGEAEWLTHDPGHLERSYRNNPDTLWARVAKHRPAWAKPGEHLSALPAIKRLWPTLFVEEVEAFVGKEIRRFVVSTHTMALAGQLEKWLDSDRPIDPDLHMKIEAAVKDPAGVALPAKFARHAKKRRDRFRFARTLCALLDEAQDDESDATSEAKKRLVKRALFDDEGGRLETYYGLLLMDGDKMGAWVSGDPNLTLKYGDTFHSQVENKLKGIPELSNYLAAPRAVSPGRHIAISSALNDFSLFVARHVVEQEFHGRLIYSGGDDVLAMLPASEVLPALVRLRQAYSGVMPDDTDGRKGDDPIPRGKGELHLSRGFAWLDGRLLRLMGGKATASAGAVIVHHQTPLSVALRELRAAEKRAKSAGGRDAFSITVMKRAGGDLRFTGKFEDAAPLVADLRDFLAHERVSRRAVYHTLEWLRDLPEPAQGDGSMLATMLAHQFARQIDKASRDDAGRKECEALLSTSATLAARLAGFGATRDKDRLAQLENLLLVGEFIARETRTGA